MNAELRQLLEDINRHASAIDKHLFTRHPLLIATAKLREASLVSTLDLQSYLDRITDIELRELAPDRFEQAALATARAWFEYWNGATMIERRALPQGVNRAEEINAGLVRASIDTAILMSGDRPGWDNVEKRPI